MAGDGKLLLTGQLGDVMEERVRAALSLVKSRAETLGIEPGIFKKNDLHVHLPAGGDPKRWSECRNYTPSRCHRLTFAPVDVLSAKMSR